MNKMDPKFVDALNTAYTAGKLERENERLKELEALKVSCDRGAEAIKKLHQDPNYQKEALASFRKGWSYCMPLNNTDSMTDIRNCMKSRDHQECRKLKERMYIEIQRCGPVGREDLCLHTSKFNM